MHSTTWESITERARTAPDHRPHSGTLTREFREYDREGERPLKGYTALTAAFGALAAGGYAALTARGRRPSGGSAADVVHIGIASHKLSRLIGKAKVTAPYRAPFTRLEDVDGAPPAEVSESARGTGLRRAFGELITCPYCMAPWLATAFWFARSGAPRTTHLAVSILESVAVSDFLQIAYRGSEDLALRGGAEASPER